MPPQTKPLTWKPASSITQKWIRHHVLSLGSPQGASRRHKGTRRSLVRIGMRSIMMQAWDKLSGNARSFLL